MAGVRMIAGTLFDRATLCVIVEEPVPRAVTAREAVDISR